MAEKKFSELTAKGATIADTDIVAISESAGGGAYTSKSVTGANIKALVTDANLTTTDVTTNDVSTSKHGFVPKAPNDTTKFLRGDGTWQVPTAGGGLTIGTTAVTSGTVGRIFFEGSGNVVQQDSTLFWDNTNKRLGIGATPSASVRVDVRSQGALSTDIAFRVRNNADTIDYFIVNGAGDTYNRGAGGISSNTFFGENVGRSSTGAQNTFFGYAAGASNSSGGNNVFIGQLSGTSNSSGANNVFMGQGSGYTNTSGGGNVFVGKSSGLNNTSGANNVFVGYDAGQSSSTSAQNTFIGNAAGYTNTGGNLNSFMGSYSGYSNTTGANNVFVGQGSGYSNTTGASNTFIGQSAGLNASSGSNNVLFGMDSGRYTNSGSSLAIVSSSIFLGADTRANASSESNQIVIGYQGRGLGSNTAVLGNDSIVTTQLRGNVISGNQSALATTATDGFLYIPTCAGTPTGTPTSITGKVPMVADTTNNKLYIYVGGAWTAMN